MAIKGPGGVSEAVLSPGEPPSSWCHRAGDIQRGGGDTMVAPPSLAGRCWVTLRGAEPLTLQQGRFGDPRGCHMARVLSPSLASKGLP